MAVHIGTDQKPAQSDHTVQVGAPCFHIPANPPVPIVKLQCRGSKPRRTKPTMLRVDQVSKLPPHKRSSTSWMLTDHHLIPDPHLFHCLYADKVQSTHFSHFPRNAFRDGDRFRKPPRATVYRLHQGLGQTNVATGLQVSKSLEATAGLPITPAVEEHVVCADLFRDTRAVHTAPLIKDGPYMLDDFGARQRSFDLVLCLHAAMLHGMGILVQT